MKRPSALPLDPPPLAGNRAERRRTTHLIRPNAAGSIPAMRVYLDTEATRTLLSPTTERQTLSFGWACRELVQKRRTKVGTYEEWYRFTSPDDAFCWLTRQTRDRSATYVYAHNWSYDAAILSLQTMAATYNWQVEEYVTSHHILWIAMRQAKRRLIFVDTLNYFATSLATLGEQIGWEKLPMPASDARVDEWDTYCKNDVALIRYAMNQYFTMLKDLDLGKYRKTAASQAYGAWRHRFMNHEVLILADEEIERLERQAYHGGRSEVFYDLPLLQTIFALDINAMYPSVMVNNVFPCRKKAKGDRLTIDQLRAELSTGCVIAEVEISTDRPVYPYMHDNRLIFPIGHFTTTLSTPELAYALAHDHLQSVSKWVSYEAAPLFREYVLFFYELRQQYRENGNIAFAYLAKLLMNSLYGKFGQRGRYWETCDADDPSEWNEWIGQCSPGTPALKHRRRFGIIQHQLEDGEAFESFPAIAAHVTAHARMKLWGLMEQAGQAHVYYCDTDSLYVDQTGYLRLHDQLDHVSLGKLKLEQRYGGLHCFAPKDYHWLDGHKTKGIRRNAKRITAEVYAERYPGESTTIAALRSGEWVCYEQQQFEGYDSILARGADGEVLVETVWKIARRQNYQSMGRGVGFRLPLVVSPSLAAD